MTTLQATIDSAWEERASLSPASAPAPVREAVAHVVDALDAGRLRVAEKRDGEWITHQWIKKAVLLSFRLADNAPIGFAGAAAPFRFYDKVETKFARFEEAQFAAAGVRVVPPAVAGRCRCVIRPATWSGRRTATRSRSTRIMSAFMPGRTRPRS